jgi:primosomal replication protein N
LTGENRVELAGRLVELGALRRTPGGIAVLEFRLKHESDRGEAGTVRKVKAEVESIAYQAEARLIAAAALDSRLRVEGFLCAKSARSKKLVLHITKVAFGQGD